MEIGLIMKIAGIGLVVAMAHQVLSRTGREEQAMLMTLAGLIAVLTMIVTQISELFETVKTVFGL